MLNCKFELEIPGYKKEFNSQEELDSFLYNNKNRIAASLEGAEVRFSKNFNKYEETIAILNSFKQRTDTSITYDEKGNKIEKFTEEGYKGVTRLLENLVINGQKIFEEFNKEDYRTRQVKDLTKKALEQDPSLNESEVRERIITEVDETIKSWDQITKLGIDIHSLANIYFSNPEIGRNELFDTYSKNNNLLNRSVIDELYQKFSDLRGKMISITGGDQNLRYYTELPIYDEETKTVGIVDLAVVDSKGNVYMIDFKASTKSIGDWDRDKEKRAKYQLVLYKQLANKNKLNVKDLIIMPIDLEGFDKDSKTIHNLGFDPDLLVRLGVSLVGKDAAITSHAGMMIPTIQSSSVNTERTGTVNKVFNKMFGEGKDSLQEFKAKNISTDSKGRFFRGLRGKVYLGKDEQENNETIEQHILEVELSKSEIVDSLKDELKSMKLDENREFRNPFDYNISRNVEIAFKKYIDEEWEILDLEEIETHGIIGFRHINYDYIDFVQVTNEPINNKIKLATGGSNILGNFVNDNDVNVRHSDKVDATNKNLAAVKLLIHLNEKINEFEDHKIHNFRTYDLTSDALEGVNLETIVKKFKFLAEKTDTPYNLNKLNFVKYADVLKAEIDNVIRYRTGTTSRVKRVLEDVLGIIAQPDDNVELVHELKEMQRRFMRDVPGFQDLNNIDWNNDLAYVWGYLNAVILELMNKKVEFIEKDMVRYGGGANSTMFSSINEVNNTVARLALEPIKIAHTTMSQNYLKKNNEIRKIFDKFYKSKGVDTYFKGNHITAFSNLFEQGPDKSLAENFSFKDPEANKGNDNYLNSSEREFLRSILPIIGEYLHDDIKLEEKKKNGQYYEVPLVRANTTSRLWEKGIASVPGGIFSAFQANYKEVLDIYNIFEEQEEDLKKAANEFTEYYDSFITSKSPALRDQMLKAHPDKRDFEKNVELIISQLVFTKMRKEAYDNALPVTHAVLAAAKLNHMGLSDKALDNTYQYVRDYVKTVVFDEKLVEKHSEKTLRRAAWLKQGVTMLQLGLQPLNLIRETLQGQIGNAVKLWANRYGDTGPSLKHYNQAINLMIGESGEFLHTVTLTEQLNYMYRIANQDTKDLAEKMRISKTGMTQMHSRWFLWTMGAPDYMNRMSFMLAKMIRDDSLKAHEMVDGELVYDWKKDGRFDVYALGEKGKQVDLEKYNAQRSLYLIMLQEFNDEAAVGGGRKKRLEEGSALPMAYTTRERESIKSFVNYVHGPYDKEEKILAHNTLFGLMFFQFKTWMLSKKTQWYLDSDQYAIGGYKHIKDANGNLLYLTEDGQETTEAKGNRPVILWEGRYMEGIWQSFIRTLKDFQENKYNPKAIIDFLKGDEEALSNLKMATADLAIFVMVSIAIAGIIDWPELEKNNPLAASLMDAVVKSTNDLFVLHNLQAFIDPTSMFPSVGYVYDQVGGLFGAMTGNGNFKNIVVRSTGITRTADSLGLTE